LKISHIFSITSLLVQTHILHV